LALFALRQADALAAALREASVANSGRRGRYRGLHGSRARLTVRWSRIARAQNRPERSRCREAGGPAGNARAVAL